MSTIRKLSGVALRRTIRIRRGHESLDVTLAKGKDAESEEAQEHANSSSLAHGFFGSRHAEATFQQAALLGRSRAAPNYRVHCPFQTILAA
jgi:hypothetical protein